MSKIIPESKIISVQHKSLIGAISGNDKSRKKEGAGTSTFSQMSVSDKKIRTLERNRNISPAPFQIDSTDTEDELELVVGRHNISKLKSKNNKHSKIDKEEHQQQPNKNNNAMARTVSQEIRSAFSLTTEFKT